MKREINPSETSRAQAFNYWMKSPMPMVTITKTFDVTKIYKFSKQKGYKFNMLLCWHIGSYRHRNRLYC
jgi:chloramphenicol O-acetyltransferase type A